MNPTRSLPALAVAAALALSGCSLPALGTSPRPGPTVTVTVPAPAPTAAPAPPPANKTRPAPPPVLRAKVVGRFGTLVVDARGRSLYRSDRDRARPSLSRCAGACAKTWPPLTVARPDQVRVAGLDPDLVGTVRRADGRLQVTLAGHPLYRFAQDKKPGDLKGQCRDNVFFAVTPEGGKTTMTGVNA